MLLRLLRNEPRGDGPGVFLCHATALLYMGGFLMPSNGSNSLCERFCAIGHISIPLYHKIAYKPFLGRCGAWGKIPVIYHFLPWEIMGFIFCSKIDTILGSFLTSPAAERRSFHSKVPKVPKVVSPHESREG